MDFLQFWFIDLPKNSIAFFLSLNNAFLQLFSLPLLVRTFFKPIKNEYREGLVGFSIGMGIFIKGTIIVVDMLLFLLLLIVELCALLALLLWPFATVYLLFL